MGDIDPEFFRQHLRELAERLGKTQGDASIVAQLKAVEKALQGLGKLEKNLQDQSTAENRKQLHEFMMEFVKELDLAKKFKKLNDAVENIELRAQDENVKVDPEGIQTFNSRLRSGAKDFGAWSKGFAGFATGTNKFLKGTFDAANGLANLDGSFGDLVNKTGLGGTAFATVAMVLDENIDGFRLLRDAADGSIQTISEMRTAMSTSALGVKEFTEAIKNGTQGTKLLGGMRWAELFKNIKDQTRAQGFYGYSNEKLIAAQGEYLEILKGQGDLLGMDSDKELTDGLLKLLKVNNKMASILGKNREDMLAQIRTQSLDTAFATAQSAAGLSEDAKTANIAAVAAADSLTPVLAQALKEGFASNGALTDERAKVIAALPKAAQTEFFKTLDAMRNGTLANEDAAKQAIQDFAKAANSGMNRAYQDVFGRLAIGGDATSQSVADIYINSKNVKQTGEDDGATTDPGTNGLLQFGQTMKDVAAGFQDVITGVLNKGLEDFGLTMTEWFGKGGFITGKIDAIRQFIQKFEYFGTALAVVGGVLATGLGLSAVAGAASLLSGAFTGAIAAGRGLGTVLGWTGRFLLGTFNLLTKPVAWAVQGIAALGRGLAAGVPIVGQVFKGLTSAIGSAVTAVGGLPGMFSKLPGMLKAAGGILSGAILTNALDALAGWVFGIGDKEIDTKQDDANWEKMNWWQTIESSLARGIENVGDYVAPSVANEARAARIADETQYFKEQEAAAKVEPKAEPKVDPITTDTTKKDAQLDAAMAEKGFTETQIKELKDHLDTTSKALVTPETVQLLQNLNTAIIDNTAAILGQIDRTATVMPSEAERLMIARFNDLQSVMAPVSDNFAAPMGAIDNITPTLDSSANTLNQTATTMDTANAAIQAMLQTQNTTLSQIMNILKNNLEYDRENGQIIRDRLSELAKTNEDLLRVSRR